MKSKSKAVSPLRSATALQTQAGFTMVEIAICLAVIAFALVAIIGVLPTGMQVQRDNREETIINQDGTYFMEAIRSGAKGLDELTKHVVEVSVTEQPAAGGAFVNVTNRCTTNNGALIIGALSAPQYWPWGSFVDCTTFNPSRQVVRTHARVRSISGVAMEKGDRETITFEYLLTSEVIPFPLSIDTAMVAFENRDPNVATNIVAGLNNHLFELRLTFRWPLLADGSPGGNRKVFRSLVSGSVETNVFGYFLQASAYRPPS